MTVECLNSYLQVLDNDYIEELIVLDNNSNKDLKDFLNKFQDSHEKIKIIFSNKKKTTTNSQLNKGIYILKSKSKTQKIIIK